MVQYLQTGTWRQAFGKELPQYLSGAFISANERGDAEDEPFRARIEVKPAPRIENAVGKPVRKHVEKQPATRGFDRFGITQQAFQ